MGLEWITKETSVTIGKCGDVVMFRVYYSALIDDDKKIQAECDLPKIKNDIGQFETIEKAKNFCEEVFQHWLNITGLKKIA